MTLTCTSAEWLIHGTAAYESGVRHVTLTDCPAVFVNETTREAYLTRPGGVTVPVGAAVNVAATAAKLLAATWPGVNFELPKRPA